MHWSVSLFSQSQRVSKYYWKRHKNYFVTKNALQLIDNLIKIEVDIASYKGGVYLW